MSKTRNFSTNPRSGAVDNVISIFEARRDLRPAAKAVVQGSGLSVEEADILILLYGVIKLGWHDLPNYDGYVNYADLKRRLVHDPSLFARRIKRLLEKGYVHARSSRESDPRFHGKAQQVRIEEKGVRAVEPVWERYCRFSEELLKGFSKTYLDAHFNVNEEICRIVRDRLDPTIQLLGLKDLQD